MTDAPPAPVKPDALWISPVELAERLAGGGGVELVDVRPEAEYRLLRIEGARLATKALAEEIFASWPKDVRVVLCDHFGEGALDAARVLSSRGFANARALAGGVDAWSREIDPLLPRYA